MLLLHIVIAIFSIVYTGFVFIYPSKTKLRISYALVASTIGTGTYLVFMAPAHMVSSCLMGVAYLGIVAAGIARAKTKLAQLLSK